MCRDEVEGGQKAREALVPHLCSRAGVDEWLRGITRHMGWTVKA
jgi:hypothetical protein